MQALLPIIEQMLIDAVISKKAPFMRKNKFGLGLLALSAILFLTALVFAFIAVYGWLLTEFEQPVAAIILASFIMGMSALSALIGIYLSRKRRPAPIQTDEISELISTLTEVLGDELLEPIKQNPKTAVLLASAVGFVAGDRLN